MRLHPATLAFLEAVQDHNTRKYFASVKDVYEDIWHTLKDVCSQSILYAQNEDANIGDIHAKDCLFRIYRDARRLKDGDHIYKNNFGFVVGVGGRKSSLPGYYLHIQPKGNSFFAAGVYAPSSQQLANLRSYIQIHGETYQKLTNTSLFKKTFGKVTGNILTRPPRGYNEDEKFIDIIKHKSHLISVNISDDDILSLDIPKLFAAYVRICEPRISFLTQGCLSTLRNEKTN